MPPQPVRPSKSVSASQFLSRFALSPFCKKSEKLNSLFSHSCALFKKECFNNSFSLNRFRALLQNTGGYTLQDTSFPASIRLPIAIPFRIRTSEKHVRKPRRIRTSKTQDLKSFRIRTYEKIPPGVPTAMPSSTVGQPFLAVFLLHLSKSLRPLCAAGQSLRYPLLLFASQSSAVGFQLQALLARRRNAAVARRKLLCVKLERQWRELRGCRSVELRALCNEVPRTPPGPEGSNGIGIASGAADHPKFLASKRILQPVV